MYEWDEEEKKVEFSHNPFSMPQGGLEALLGKDPLAIKAFQYDIACNGYELASGGIRNHRPEAMLKAFEIAGYGEETVVERFGGMYRAFHYGAPPHGGMAAGVDRIVMLLAGEQNLREVALFPMNQRAEDLLMGAPIAGDAEAIARAPHPRRRRRRSEDGSARSVGAVSSRFGVIPKGCGAIPSRLTDGWKEGVLYTHLNCIIALEIDGAATKELSSAGTKFAHGGRWIDRCAIKPVGWRAAALSGRRAASTPLLDQALGVTSRWTREGKAARS